MSWRTALILGGARSGKTQRALALAEAFAKRVYIATAQPLDEEMSDRIQRHRRERGDRWITVEVPLDLPEAILSLQDPGAVCVIDCLTLWLSNLMGAGRAVDQGVRSLCDAIGATQQCLIVVSNEVGLGLVPDTPLGRAFRDHQGRLNQAAASTVDRVEFVAAGLPLILKA